MFPCTPDTDREVLTCELNGIACREIARKVGDDGSCRTSSWASPAAA